MYFHYRNFVIIIFISFFSHSLEAQIGPKLRIDPSQAYGGPVSEYFDSVEYIPLETTKESLFGDAHTVMITDSSIVVYDIDTKSILFFALTGKFLTKVKQYNSYMRVGYNSETKQIVATLTDLNPEITKTYSLLGKLINITKDKSSAAQEVINRVPIGNGYFAKANNYYLYNNQKPTDSVGYLVDIYKGDKLYNRLFPINQAKNLFFSELVGQIWLPNVVRNRTFYVSSGLNYDLYKVNKDSATKISQFVFPANRSIPQNYISSGDAKLLDKVKEQLPRTLTILGVSNIFFIKKHLFFKINTGEYIFNESTESSAIYNFIYDTISHSLIAFERITPDSLTSFLPLFDNNIKLYGLQYNKGHFYSTISSLKLFAAYKKNKSRNPHYPKLLQIFFNNQNRKSNLVIVKMKLKDF